MSGFYSETHKFHPLPRLKTTSKSCTSPAASWSPAAPIGKPHNAQCSSWLLPVDAFLQQNSTPKRIIYIFFFFCYFLERNWTHIFFWTPTGELQRQTWRSAGGLDLWGHPSSNASNNVRAVDAPQPACERRSVGDGRFLSRRVQVHRVEEPNHLLHRHWYSAQVPGEHGDAVSRRLKKEGDAAVFSFLFNVFFSFLKLCILEVLLIPPESEGGKIILIISR